MYKDHSTGNGKTKHKKMDISEVYETPHHNVSSFMGLKIETLEQQ
jgi:hypothetical protein